MAVLRGTTPRPATRLPSPDPAFSGIFTDLYNKLAQAQAQIEALRITAGTYTLTSGSTITVNAQGQITSIT